MAKKTSKKVVYLMDADGNKVRADMLKESIVDQHNYAVAMAKQYELINEALQAKKNELESLSDEYLAKVAEGAGLDHYEGFAISYSFDKRVKVESREVEFIAYDTTVAAAIERMRKWLTGLQANTNKKIITIINKILKVSNSGSISKARLNELCSFGFEDEEYQEIVKQIQGGMQVINKKRYTSVYRKDDEGKWEAVKVNLTSL